MRIKNTLLRDSNGKEVHEVSLVEVEPDRLSQSIAEATVAQIAHLNPSRSSRSGEYSYKSPVFGEGQLELQDSYTTERHFIDEKVHMLEIERGIGRRDPMRLPDTHEYMTAIQLHIQNPYLQILFGVIAIGVSIFIILVPGTIPTSSQALKILLPILGVLVMGVATYFILWRGISRITWWHAARAYVKQRGEKLPRYLKVFS